MVDENEFSAVITRKNIYLTCKFDGTCGLNLSADPEELAEDNDVTSGTRMGPYRIR